MRNGHITHLINRYLDGQLSPSQRARVINHARGCAACRATLAREERLAADLRRELPSMGQVRAGQLAQVWAGVRKDMSASRPRVGAGLPGVSVALAMVLALAVALPLLIESGLRAEAAPLQPRPISTASPTPDASETEATRAPGTFDLAEPHATVALAASAGLTPAPVPQATVSPEAGGGGAHRR
jgi:anti-sigma factor RsiW